MLRGKLTSLRPHTAMSERRTCATGICQRICKAHIFDETFRVNRAFNAELFVAAPHAVAMEFDLFGQRRSSHWVSERVLFRALLHVTSCFKKPTLNHEHTRKGNTALHKK